MNGQTDYARYQLMRYAQESRIPDPYGIGCLDLSSYLCVNTAGYYQIDQTRIPIRRIYRKNGRLDYLLCYVHEGRMRVRYNKQEHILNKGFFINTPHVENYYWQDTNDNYHIFWVHFTGYGAEELLKSVGLANGGVFNVGACDELPPILEKMIKEMCLKNPGYETITASLLMLIVSLLGRKVAKQMEDNQNAVDPRISRVIDHIRKQYFEQMHVKSLANMAELSTSHFARLFRQHTGLYPLQYIINYRLQKSCELMRHAHLTIKEISNFVGFDDPLYFSRLFKKHMGISPTDYLNNLKNDSLLIFSPELEKEV